MDSVAMDPIDREILDVLQHEGRISWQELGRRIRLSPTATAERVRRLERAGVIVGYAARVDPAAIGRPLEVLVDVRLQPEVRTDFVREALAEEAVTEIVHATGRADFVVRARCQDPPDLDRLLELLRRLGAAQTETRLLLHRFTA